MAPTDAAERMSVPLALLFRSRPSAIPRGQIPADATLSSSSAHTTSRNFTAIHVATALGLSALQRSRGRLLRARRRSDAALHGPLHHNMSTRPRPGTPAAEDKAAHPARWVAGHWTKSRPTYPGRPTPTCMWRRRRHQQNMQTSPPIPTGRAQQARSARRRRHFSARRSRASWPQREGNQRFSTLRPMDGPGMSTFIIAEAGSRPPRLTQ